MLIIIYKNLSFVFVLLNSDKVTNVFKLKWYKKNTMCVTDPCGQDKNANNTLFSIIVFLSIVKSKQNKFSIVVIFIL